MATQGAVETFRTGSFGGSPYASAYADQFRNEQFKQVLEMTDEARKQRSFDLAEKRLAEKEARDKIIEELQMRSSLRQDEAEKRKLKRDEDREALLDTADSVISQIDDVDHLRKDAPDMLEKIRHSQDFTRVLTNRNTRDAVLSAFKSKTQQHSDLINGFRGEAKSKYGVDVDPSTLKTDENNRFDTAHIYSTQLPQMAQEATIKSQQAYESAGQRPGYIKYQEMDEYGRPVVKYTKAPTVKMPKQEDLAKEFKSTYGAPVESLSAEYSSKPINRGVAAIRGSYDENGKFVPSPTGETVQVVDATKGIDKKIVHNIPYEKFESFRTKVQGMNKPSQILTAPEGVEISSPIGVQTNPLPSSTPPATTEQPQQTQRYIYDPSTGNLNPQQ